MHCYRNLLNLASLPSIASEGRGVRIAVLDTGIPEVHGIPVSYARDFCPHKETNLDHVTFIGSILFGVGDIRGVCPAATSYFGKVFENITAKPSVVAEAIRHAVNVWDVDIINLSLGFSSRLDCNPDLKEACTEAIDKGVIIVASAGNDGGQTMWPAALPGVISVGAADGVTKAVYSNKGKIDFVAPGTNLVGLTPTGGITTKTGTSYATAIITGLIGLLIGKKKQLQQIYTAVEIIKELISLCTDLASPGKDSETGHGYPFPLPFKKTLGLRIKHIYAKIKETIKKVLRLK